MKEIREFAFKNCLKLTNINIQYEIESINPTVFEGCEKLDVTNLNCSDKIKKSLQSQLTIDKRLERIKKKDFLDYYNIEILEIPLKVEIHQPELFFSIFKRLKHVECNPIYLQSIPNKEMI